MSRQVARDRAFKLIFEYIFTHEIDEDLLGEFLLEDNVKDEVDYVREVYFGVAKVYDELSSAIEELSVGFSSKRIFKVDTAIMLLAAYEIKYMPDIPRKVSINEACNLAKMYSTEKSVSFVNGILAKI